MRLECQACGGQYDDVLPDGMRYFHACPPIALPVVIRDGQKVALPPADVKEGEVVIDVRTVPRANARDENVLQVRDDDNAPISVMKAEGAGAIVIVAVDDVVMPSADQLTAIGADATAASSGSTTATPDAP